MPWTRGYEEAKLEFLRKALTDADLLRRFRAGDGLPAGYGKRLDERVVEYPWALSRLKQGARRLLDAGSTLNFPELLGLPLLHDKAVHIVTLAPESRCSWHRGVSYIFADLRDLPVRDGFYDEIVCLSPLEHVGRDNSQYGATSSAENGSFAVAVRELRRVLRPGGTLLLSVPYGRPTSLPWMQQFDAALVEKVKEAFAPSEASVDVFAYTKDGWGRSDLAAAAGAEYFDVRSGAPIAPDGAAAARAVACLTLRK